MIGTNQSDIPQPGDEWEFKLPGKRKRVKEVGSIDTREFITERATAPPWKHKNGTALLRQLEASKQGSLYRNHGQETHGIRTPRLHESRKRSTLRGNCGTERARARTTQESSGVIGMETNQSFQVGDKVRFVDDGGKLQLSVITRVVPKGEYSGDQVAYAIKGIRGLYVRVYSELSAEDIESLMRR